MKLEHLPHQKMEIVAVVWPAINTITFEQFSMVLQTETLPWHMNSHKPRMMESRTTLLTWDTMGH